ncbi:hypothetical protein ALC56_05046, partial [Trachymyrmex septentrionalis]
RRASPVRAVSARSLPARSLPIQLESPMFTSPTARDHKMAECSSPTSYGPRPDTFTLDRPAETRVRGLGTSYECFALARPRDAVTARRRGGEPRGIACSRCR